MPRWSTKSLFQILVGVIAGVVSTLVARMLLPDGDARELRKAISELAHAVKDKRAEQAEWETNLTKTLAEKSFTATLQERLLDMDRRLHGALHAKRVSEDAVAELQRELTELRSAMESKDKAVTELKGQLSKALAEQTKNEHAIAALHSRIGDVQSQLAKVAKPSPAASTRSAEVDPMKLPTVLRGDWILPGKFYPAAHRNSGSR